MTDLVILLCWQSHCMLVLQPTQVNTQGDSSGVTASGSSSSACVCVCVSVTVKQAQRAITS